MIELQNKLSRIRRLCEVDRSQLSTYVVELAKADSQIQQIQQRINRTNDELNRNGCQSGGETVAARHQSVYFADHLAVRILKLQPVLVDATKRRDDCMRMVVQQQTKIKGWETLIEKLNHELLLEQQNQESMIADDHYLSHITGRNS